MCVCVCVCVCVCAFAAVRDLTGIMMDLYRSCWKNRCVKHNHNAVSSRLAYATLSVAEMTTLTRSTDNCFVKKNAFTPISVEKKDSLANSHFR